MGIKAEIIQSDRSLKRLMLREKNGQNKEKLQALFLLKTGECKYVSQVAKIVGRDRSTVHRWLDIYREQGLEALLAEKPKTGRKRKIPDWAIFRLKEFLEETEGFTSYREIHCWLKDECEVDVSYNVVYQLLRSHLEITIKLSR